jgi:hypothetical protein
MEVLMACVNVDTGISRFCTSVDPLKKAAQQNNKNKNKKSDKNAFRLALYIKFHFMDLV